MFNLKIKPVLKEYYREEVSAYRNFLQQGKFAEAWHHLERAHIIGQAYPLEHTYSHWLMLKFGFMIKDKKEILGQIPRLLAGGIKSFIGTIPTGNTGRANVSPFRPMHISSELQSILNKAKTS